MLTKSSCQIIGYADIQNARLARQNIDVVAMLHRIMIDQPKAEESDAAHRTAGPSARAEALGRDDKA